MLNTFLCSYSLTFAVWTDDLRCFPQQPQSSCPVAQLPVLSTLRYNREYRLYRAMVIHKCMVVLVVYAPLHRNLGLAKSWIYISCEPYLITSVYLRSNILECVLRQLFLKLLHIIMFPHLYIKYYSIFIYNISMRMFYNYKFLFLPFSLIHIDMCVCIIIYTKFCN